MFDDDEEGRLLKGRNVALYAKGKTSLAIMLAGEEKMLAERVGLKVVEGGPEFGDLSIETSMSTWMLFVAALEARGSEVSAQIRTGADGTVAIPIDLMIFRCRPVYP